MKIQVPQTNPETSILLRYFNSINWLVQLAPKEMEVMEQFVNRYFELKKLPLAESVIYSLVFIKDEKKKIRERLNLPVNQFNVLMCKLRDKQAIIKDSEGRDNILPLLLFNSEKDKELTLIF